MHQPASENAKNDDRDTDFRDRASAQERIQELTSEARKA